ncbi:MAG: Na+/H+ antiporter subunit E [Alphaproteobacteria bacterium 64-6]|nr:MAG: Na+/H+ antiporter subunit E [Alphaproteobacteria bacterium 64-6]
MRRWLPFPVISAMLLGTWLLLNESLSAGQLLLGGILAVAGSWILVRLEAPSLLFRRLRVILRLGVEVIVDMARSNYRVARLIIRDKPDRTPGFVRIQLKVRSHYSLALLACIVTATPGTSWVAYEPANNVLIIHVLDLVDDDDWGEIIRVRYEGLLKEIFE